jgi:hypothetical protein
MRKVANLKKYAPLPLLQKGEVFALSGRKFTVKDVSQYQAESKEYVAQCEIETVGCRIVLLMTSKRPFAMEGEHV